MKRSLSIVIGIAILGIGLLVSAMLIIHKPKAEKQPRPRMIPVVHCESIDPKDHAAQLHVMGTVIAAQKITLKARVFGEIIDASPNWIEGGTFQKGETILQLDDADYRIAVEQAQAALAQAESDLALEMGRQDIARRELEIVSQTEALGGSNKLALRAPQLKSAQAKVASAKASLERAQLDLERTRIKAPFDAVVLARSMDKGDQVSAQTVLGTLVATDRYHVLVSIAVDQLPWIVWPTDKKPGSTGSIRLPDGTMREGHVLKRLADLEPDGRMARMLMEITDPLSGNSPVLLDSYVSVDIEGRAIPHAYAFSRDAVHEGDMIWLLTSTNTLKIVNVKRVFAGRRNLYVHADIDPNDRLITSDLPAPVAGMDIRSAGEEDANKPDA